VTPEVAACPACKASPISGHYCRECGAALPPPSPQAEHHPAQPTAPAGPPQPASIHQQPVSADAPPLTGQAHYAPTGQTNGWAQPSVPPPAPLPSSSPASYWIPMPAQGSAPGRRSTALAAGATIAIVLVLLAIAATVILLVASGGSNHTGILTQSTATGSKSEQAASP
jgi:hypothetical protein